MKEVEEFVRQYFIDNDIPLKLRGDIDTVKMSCYGHVIAKCSHNTPTNFAKKWFIKKPKTVRIYTYILSKTNKKYCPKCSKIKDIEYFAFSSHEQDNLQAGCKSCAKEYRDLNKEAMSEYSKQHYLNNKPAYRAKDAKYRASKLNRTPSWANLEKIKEFYLNCPKGYHVDHIIPLQGETISGLHVENNLQYLPASENLSKGNKWPIEQS